MLAPMLATRDPYAAASLFCLAGWQLDAGVPETDGRLRAQVSLARTRVLLVSHGGARADPQPTEPPTTDPSRNGAAPGRAASLGAGVELHLPVPPGELAKMFLLHRAAGVAVSQLGPQLESSRGFVAEIVGYRFVIAAGDPEWDLAEVPADPRIVRLAAALARAQRSTRAPSPRGPAAGRETDQQPADPDLLTDTALSLLEACGQTVRSLRAARAQGLTPGARRAVGVDLAEVVIEAAVLARQLGVDLATDVDERLHRMAVPVGRRAS